MGKGVFCIQLKIHKSSVIFANRLDHLSIVKTFFRLKTHPFQLLVVTFQTIYALVSVYFKLINFPLSIECQFLPLNYAKVYHNRNAQKS